MNVYVRVNLAITAENHVIELLTKGIVGDFLIVN
ncbi:hypothetical protein SRABI134_00561 [Peribacillus sp. Bi134]|nr:hypothetical protein SRABI134_00561 [Peribacillus sp. Bi134]